MQQFIRLWQASKTLKQVARSLRLSQEEVLSRAVLFRLEGATLKPLNLSPKLFSVWWNAAETVEDLRVMLAFTPASLRRHRFAAACCGYLLRALPERASPAFIAYQDALALEALGEAGRN